MAGCDEFGCEGRVPRIAGSVPFFVGCFGSAGVEPRMGTDGHGWLGLWGMSKGVA